MQRLKFLILTLLLLVPASRPAQAAAPINQTNAQDTAKKLNDTGADDSIQGAVTNGMRALNDIGNLNLPSALQHGLKGYGQYRNSETLDQLKEQNAQNSAKMGSGSGNTSTSTHYVSPFARLPKNFLYEGEAGRLAAEVEKISGVSRESLLNKVISLETQSKRVPDSQWTSWVLNATGEFAESIPNEKFRDALVSAHNLAVKLVANGQALGIVAKFKNGQGAAAESALSAGSAASAKVTATEKSAPAKSAAPVPAPARMATAAATPVQPASLRPKKMPTSISGIHQAESRDEFMDKLVNTAVNTKETGEATIFQMVSAKIRQVHLRQRP